jgi:hypothetical protein
MHHPSPTEWLKLIEEFRAGDLQQKEFAAKHNVHLSTFQYWLYRKAKAVRVESNPSPKFLPVTVVASPALKARVQSDVLVELRDGVKVRFGVGTDTRYLAELIAALG